MIQEVTITKHQRRDRPYSDDETKVRSQNHRKMIPHRSSKIDDLIHDWGDRERQAIVLEAEDILENSLHGILSPRENKKSASEGSPKPNGMSSLERHASNSDGSSGEQPRARYQYQYEQRPLYHDDQMTYRSRSAGYSEQSEYHREDYYGRDDRMQVAKPTSAQGNQYESHSRREFRGVEQEWSGKPHQGVRSAEFDQSYQRDARIMAPQNGQQYRSPTLERSTSTTSSNGHYLPGPPKPPRRQQSLNRIHIPSGPDYDEDPRSRSDSEFFSTSPESGSPKQWQTSPLIEPQRGFAIVGSPQSVQNQSVPRQQIPQTVARNQNHKEYNRANAYARSPEIIPTNQYPQQNQFPRKERVRSPASPNLAPSLPPRQPNIVRQSSMPVSHSPPQNLPRKQNVQRAASIGRRPDDYKLQDMSKNPRTEPYNSYRRPANAVQDSHSQMKGSDPKTRPVGEHKGHSQRRPEQMGRSQPTHIPEKIRQRKISSPEQSSNVDSRDTERRSSVPLVTTEKFVVQDKQTATYASPHQTHPTSAQKKGGLGALLISDKDHDKVTVEAVEWMSQGTEYFSKPEYVSDSGISSLREVPSGPKVKSSGPSRQGVPTSTRDREYSIKPQLAFNEDTAQYKLYGDGPLEYSSYGNTRDKKFQLPKPSSYERQLSEEHPGWQRPVSPYHSSYSLEREFVEQPKRRSPRKELLRSSSPESPDPNWGSNVSHGMRSRSAQQSNRYDAWQQYSKSDGSPLAQYREDEINSPVEYAAKISHYDFPTKHYSADLESTKPASSSSRNGRAPVDVQRIKASPNRYTSETDVIGTEPAIDGGEAYWGMEFQRPAERFSHRQSPPEKASSYHSSQNSQQSSVGPRSKSPVYSGRGYDERVSSNRPGADIRENRIQMTDASVVQSAQPVERQSRYDRLKQHAGTQRRAQSLGGGSDTQRRSKSLTRLGSPDKIPSSTELPQKSLQSKSTDDLEELKKKGVSRGAALFIRMMEQASMEEDDYDLSTVEPVAIDNYVGTPKLFQPQITKTGEPILELNRPVMSPDSDSKVSAVSSFRLEFPKSNHEPLHSTKIKSSVAYASPPPKTEFSDNSPLVITRRGKQEVPAEWLEKQDRLKRTPAVDKPSSSLTKPKSDSEQFTTVRHGKQEVPVEWLVKQQSLKRTLGGENRRAPLTKSMSLDSEPIIATDQNSNQKKHVRSVTKGDQQKRSPYVESPKISASKAQATNSEPTVYHHSRQQVPTHSPKKIDVPKGTPIVEKSPSSPSKLNSLDSEAMPTIRRGKQVVPVEWVEVLERLRGKPKSQSSDSLSPVGRRDKDQRVSADFEDALSELEHMYSILDQEADDLIFRKSNKSFDQRIAELPPALQKRLNDLKEYATSQRNKRRARRERSKSDLALKTKAPSKTPASDGQKKHEFPPYRTSGSAVKPTKSAFLDMPVKTSDRRQRAHHHSPRNEQSSSDEETPSLPRSTYQLYRKPRSDNNLGRSSDSSPELSHRHNHASQSILERPGKKSDPPTRKPGSYFEAITGLDLPKYKPSAKNSESRSHKPVEDSPNHNKVQEVVTKSSAADVNTSQFAFEKLNAGSRLSIDSVSTVDSFQLSQPFDEMSSEYHKLSTDHRMDMASDGDISPSQQSSSMESLVLSVASPGGGPLQRQPPKSRRKQGKEISTADRQKADGEKTASRGPVPLATFDEELASSPPKLSPNKNILNDVSKRKNRPSAFAGILHLLSWIDSTDV
ncbi:uncharacterized protein LOC119740430 isoform X3 [Patiria miniata]|uniref:Uncharacterized protein n=1 Tax=Patiria miniata TaxID=46514 RepID=A0A914B8B1_PATMI|nr:uncharacterized protein LOC119740430 isoform X3 [Patiria miniata]